MKRQHPDDPNLFWCSSCQSYKAKEAFGSSQWSGSGITYGCRKCRSSEQMVRYYKDPSKCHGRTKKYYQLHPEKVRARSARRRAVDPQKCRNAAKKSKEKGISELRDYYLISNMKRDGIPTTPETIELKRQQIIAKRTLKQFQEWRKENENESNHTDVYGKQCADEENYEGGISVG